MNILFLTLVEFNSLEERNIYTDLLREFKKNGHRVCAISPIEKRKNIKTHVVNEGSTRILRLQTGNAQKTNIIEKGMSILKLQSQYRKAIEYYFSDIRFDLILYSTPPITLVDAVQFVKNRDNAVTYLLLKDIFPQNAVDIGMLSMKGIKAVLYKHFRRQEINLYRVSDHIGCMSQANVEYVLRHNPDIDSSKVEICPNSIEVVDKQIDKETRFHIRKKYGIPQEKKVFVYGGNLGKPQGIPFFIECLKESADISDAFFLVIGDGTEYSLLEKYEKDSNQTNFKLMKRLPKEDFDLMVAACDIGMIFLDYRFTIPNFPSRILSYMQAHLPVLAITDQASDVGKVIENAEFGWYCSSNNSKEVKRKIKEIIKCQDLAMKDNSFIYLKDNYSVEKSYNIIMSKLKGVTER